MDDRSRSRSARALGSVAVVGLLLAACTAGAGATAAAPSASPSGATAASVAPPASVAPTQSAAAGGGRYGGGGSSPSTPAAGSVVVSVATTSLGPVLAGPNGNTLYVHAGDSATSSTCTGGCLTAWPALGVTGGGTATAGSGVTGTLATFKRADDSSTQVTYNGQPLYYWQGDGKAGDVTGQGIANFTVAKP